MTTPAQKFATSAADAKEKIRAHLGKEACTQVNIDIDDKKVLVRVARRGSTESAIALPFLSALLLEVDVEADAVRLLCSGKPLDLPEVAAPGAESVYRALDLIMLRAGWQYCEGLCDTKYTTLKEISPAVCWTSFAGSVVRHEACAHRCGFVSVDEGTNDMHRFIDGTVVCRPCYQLSRSLDKRLRSNTEHFADSTSNVRLDLLNEQQMHERYEHLYGRLHALQKTVQRAWIKLELVEASAAEARDLLDDLSSIDANVPADVKAQVLDSDPLVKETWHSQLSELTNGVKNGQGVRYSPLLIRIALAIYTRSPKALSVIKDFKVLPVPSKSTILRYANAYRHGSGMSETMALQMAAAKERFELLCRERGVAPANRIDGIVVIDGVHLNGNVVYNATTRKIVGYAADLSQLDDLFRDPATVDETGDGTTKHALQTMFRCAAIDFECLGPYYAMTDAGDHRIIEHAQKEFCWLLIQYGFMPYLTVLDGSSQNQAFIRHAVDIKFDESWSDEEILNWIPATKNFLGIQGLTMFYTVCPAHQLKNLINALHHSQPGGTKAFVFDPNEEMADELSTMSWTFIKEVWDRDNQRQRAGLQRNCPGLTQDAIDRAAFAKLNVGLALAPVKGAVAADLLSHMETTGDWSALKTMEYLKGIQRTFTYGLLYKRLSLKSDENAFFGSDIEAQDAFSGTHVAPPLAQPAVAVQTAPQPSSSADESFHPSAFDNRAEGDDDDDAGDDDAEGAKYAEIGTFCEFFLWLLRWRANVRYFRTQNDLKASQTERMFLAPETFFLTVLLIQGFRAWSSEFFRFHRADGARLFLVRITGSALELVFCNLRQQPGHHGAISEHDFQKGYASYLVTQECNAFNSPYNIDNKKPHDSRHSLNPMTRSGLKRKYLGDVSNVMTD